MTTTPVQLTDAEIRMILNAVAFWSSEISAERFARHMEKIKSVTAKLEAAVA